MLDDTKSSPGEWFDCVNVGDDYEEKADRRKDSALVIPGYSLVEVVGIRKINDDHFVHEVRLPVGEAAVGQDEATDADGNVPKYVTNGINFMFTGQGPIEKLYKGRVKYAPTLVRYEGDSSDNAKVFGRYVREPNSKLSGTIEDGLEKLYGTGTVQQLVGDPKGHLKLPNDLTKASMFKIQHQMLGWNVHGIYKYHTGEKTKGKKDDEDSTKNLLAFVAPANQLVPPPPIHYVTKEPFSTYILKEYLSGLYDGYGVATDEDLDLDGDSREGQKYAVMVDGDNPVPVSVLHKDPDGNDKMLISFVGDDIQGVVKLATGGVETTEISLSAATVTPDYIAAKIGELPGINAEDLKVSIWPGRWLIEFAGELSGLEFDLFEVDILETSDFEVHVTKTDFADSEMDADVYYPLPMIGAWDEDNEVINDAVAGGSLGTAQWFPGEGWVSDVNECRDYNGDETPEMT